MGKVIRNAIPRLTLRLFSTKMVDEYTKLPILGYGILRSMKHLSPKRMSRGFGANCIDNPGVCLFCMMLKSFPCNNFSLQGLYGMHSVSSFTTLRQVWWSPNPDTHWWKINET